MQEMISSEEKDQEYGKIEEVLFTGDLASLSPKQRVQHVVKLCNSLGLNPLTKPFEYLRLNGKLTLYARKDATDQLRRKYNVSISKVETSHTEGMFMVRVYASTPDGRTDCDIGVIPINGLSGDKLANTIMKAHTKAKRRVTLSICGLGLLDESEIESIPNAQPVPEVEVIEEVLPPIEELLHELHELVMLDLVDTSIYDKWFEKAGVSKFEDMTASQLNGCIGYLKKKKAEQDKDEGEWDMEEETE